MREARDDSHNKIVIEEQKTGHTYRLLFVNGQLIASSIGFPPYVIGDGKTSIEELVEKRNRNKVPAQRIVLNPYYLKKRSIDPSDVPEVGVAAPATKLTLLLEILRI